MKARIISLTLIGLCVLSILVGILHTFIAIRSHDEETPENIEQSSLWDFSAGENKIALLSLNGVISSEQPENLFSDAGSAESLQKALRKILKDSSVKGVLIKINSPGGTVGLSQEINSLLLRIRKKMPVVVTMSDLAASGGYYIACAADRIYAQPGTLTGSIGVIMQSLDAHELLTNKLGIRANTIKSGKFKDIASPYRALPPEERALLQNLINNTYNQFVNAIITGRVKRNDEYNIARAKLSESTLRKYADGRVFTGEQAKKLGFVDELGGLYEAQQAINKMAKQKFKLSAKELPLVQYNAPTGIENLLFGVTESFFGGSKDVTRELLPAGVKHSHQLLYIWE